MLWRPYGLTLVQAVMRATVANERNAAEVNSEQGMWAVFQGRNLIRFIISAWPKITQQFVGLTVFNTYATYFCTFPTAASLHLTIRSGRLTLPLSSPICRQRRPLPRHAHPILRAADRHVHHDGLDGPARSAPANHLSVRRDGPLPSCARYHRLHRLLAEVH